jgi:uncharacterized protein
LRAFLKRGERERERELICLAIVLIGTGREWKEIDPEVIEYYSNKGITIETYSTVCYLIS